MAVYLVDASALYPLVVQLRERILDYIDSLVVLDLTVYEVGNVVWKEARRGRITDPEAVARLFEAVFSEMRIIGVKDSVVGVVRLAFRGGLIFYDASYLYAARLHGLRLVTEGEDLAKYPGAVSVRGLLAELGVST